MKINVYSVFDVKAAVFAHPFYMVNDAVAVRGFGQAVNRPDTDFGKHPEDYSLYRIGVFDDAVGSLVSEPQPVAICTAASMKVVAKAIEPEIVK